jgi:hypothetical protein
MLSCKRNINGSDVIDILNNSLNKKNSLAVSLFEMLKHNSIDAFNLDSYVTAYNNIENIVNTMPAFEFTDIEDIDDKILKLYVLITIIEYIELCEEYRYLLFQQVYMLYYALLDSEEGYLCNNGFYNKNLDSETVKLQDNLYNTLIANICSFNDLKKGVKLC